jgi:hypothetical protein
MAEEKSLREEIKEIKELVENRLDKKKPKKFKLPFKSRVSKSKLRKGYITVASINENKSIEFRREPIIDSTFKLDDTFHTLDERDIYTYKGKPFIFQAKSKLNPYSPLTGDNETYGQKYVVARMEGDKIVGKRKIGFGISIGVLIIIGVVVYALLTGE